jgi:hypothetical protein
MGIADYRKAGDEGILAMGWGSGTAWLPYLISVSTLFVIKSWVIIDRDLCYLTAL